ncbi:MAG: CvpA family protein [Verrucomicrobia bacterium]|nr:CvpA family protein [Verrucomicrobiota bacterium]
MNADHRFPVNWFDLVVVAVLVVGVLRGRKRGMSQELVDLIQWLAIICGGAFLYQPLGQTFAQFTSSGMLFSYVFVYLLIAVVIKLFFMMIKHSIGGKLVGSDVFGGAEYYLGMPAGMVRFACVLMMALALLNARSFTAEEIAADDKFQNDVYGSKFFPGLNALQNEVFENSLSGSFVKKQLEFLLITPTAPSNRKFKLKEFNPL